MGVGLSFGHTRLASSSHYPDSTLGRENELNYVLFPALSVRGAYETKLIFALIFPNAFNSLHKSPMS